MKNVKIEKTGPANGKNFAKFVSVKMEGKVMKMVKGGDDSLEKAIIIIDDIVGG